MKVNASCAPSKNFRVEQTPDKPGFALARFFENVQEVEEDEDDNITKSYVYDEYHLELLYYDNIEADIKANFDNMINQAKIEEEQKGLTVKKLKEENDKLKTQLVESKNTITNLQVTLCNFYENSL